jgi:hypothetical protein
LFEKSIDNVQSIIDEGPIEDENDQHGFIPTCVFSNPPEFSIENNIRFLSWPKSDSLPLNEFDTPQLATLCFPKLFPLGHADPTRKDELQQLSEAEATSHLLRLVEVHPVNQKIYYPFAMHDRFIFFMQDRIQRHRILEQTRIFLKQHPGDRALNLDEIQNMINHGEEDGLIRRMSAYAANITGTPAYW